MRTPRVALAALPLLAGAWAFSDALGGHLCALALSALSTVTLSLLADALAHCAGERVLAVCDKHGARNQYGRLLQQQFPDVLVEVHGEGAAESIYRWGPGETRIDVRFRPGA